jgi:hypothetical protein
MQPADRAEMARILVSLAEMKPGGKITPEALELWYSAMSAWTIEEFRAAAQHLMLHEEYFPNPWHFQQLRKAQRMTPGEGWAIALQHVRSGAYHAGPAIPEVERTVQAMGGWKVIAWSSVDALPFLEKRFASHYDQLTDVAETRQELPQLAHDNPVLGLLAEMKK